MRRARRVVVWWLSGLAVGVVVLVLAPGRKQANAHPTVRGGGDWGFGGSDGKVT